MKKISSVVVVLFILGLLPSCAGGIPAQAPKIDPKALATIVAGTLSAMPQAIPPSKPDVSPEPALKPTPAASDVLPHNLYYQAADANGKWQIYSLGRDGHTITQITREAEGVNYFDVSRADGRLVYSTGARLVLTDPEGTNPRLIAESPNSPNNRYKAYPHWSPDGQSIAYVDDSGISFYLVGSGSSTRMLSSDPAADLIYDEVGSFSPDGSKLVVHKQWSNGIYDILTGAVALLHIPEQPQAIFACSPIYWANDSKSLYVAEWIGAAGVGCIRQPGLWRFNLDGTGTTLLPGIDETGRGFYTAAGALKHDGDNLVYLYSQPEPNVMIPKVVLTRSRPDGVTDRAVLRPDTFNMSDGTLWTPDGSALVIAQNIETGNRFMNMVLVPVDPALPVVTLMTDASQLSWNPMRWGP